MPPADPLADRIRAHFAECARLVEDAGDELGESIAAAVAACFESLANDGRILACADSGARGDAAYLVRQLTSRFERERPALAAFVLDADATDDSDALARQILGLGRAGDVLFVLSAAGQAAALLAAVDAARERGLRVVALTGMNGGALGERLAPALDDDDHASAVDAESNADVHIRVTHARLPRVRELHRLILHAICDGIDWNLLGDAP